MSLKDTKKVKTVNVLQEYPSLEVKTKVISPSHHPKINPTTNVAASVMESTSTKTELVRFLYAYYFFPVISTWIRAINSGNYASFPGLASTLVSC